MKREDGKIYVRVIPDTSEIDAAIQKAKKLNDLLNEAMETAASIANLKLDIRFRTEVDNKTAEFASITAE